MRGVGSVSLEKRTYRDPLSKNWGFRQSQIILPRSSDLEVVNACVVGPQTDTPVWAEDGVSPDWQHAQLCSDTFHCYPKMDGFSASFESAHAREEEAGSSESQGDISRCCTSALSSLKAPNSMIAFWVDGVIQAQTWGGMVSAEEGLRDMRWQGWACYPRLGSHSHSSCPQSSCPQHSDLFLVLFPDTIIHLFVHSTNIC